MAINLMPAGPEGDVDFTGPGTCSLSRHFESYLKCI